MSDNKRIRIDRQELFKQVWNKSMVQLAKDYDLSDVGLRKICKRLKVPTPPQGYWARKHRKEPPKLPHTDGPQFHEIINIEKPEKIEPEYFDERTRDLIINEEKPQNVIKVSQRLHNIHPLVEKTRKHIENARADDYNRIHSHRSDGLGISVCEDSIPRALRILDALVKALEKRGFKVSSNNGKAEVVVLGEVISFTIFEATKRYINVVTEEMRKKNKYKYYQRYVYKPSGVLELSIDRWRYGHKINIKDGKKEKVEDQLNDFVVGLIKTADTIKLKNAERQREEEERQRRRNIKEASQRQSDHEQANRDGLMELANDWQKAQQLREFIEAVEQRFHPIPPGSGVAGWIIWATNYANKLDPLTGSRSRKIRT
jgi:hypothetical protein